MLANIAIEKRRGYQREHDQEDNRATDQNPYGSPYAATLDYDGVTIRVCKSFCNHFELRYCYIPILLLSYNLVKLGFYEAEAM